MILKSYCKEQEPDKNQLGDRKPLWGFLLQLISVLVSIAHFSLFKEMRNAIGRKRRNIILKTID